MANCDVCPLHACNPFPSCTRYARIQLVTTLGIALHMRDQQCLCSAVCQEQEVVLPSTRSVGASLASGYNEQYSHVSEANMQYSILFRWIHVLPGSSQYTKSFTSCTDQDMKRTISRHLRPIFCDPAKDFKQIKETLDPWLHVLLQSADSRLQRERKSSTVSAQVDLLAQDCLQV